MNRLNRSVIKEEEPLRISIGSVDNYFLDVQ